MPPVAGEDDSPASTEWKKTLIMKIDSRQHLLTLEPCSFCLLPSALEQHTKSDISQERIEGTHILDLTQIYLIIAHLHQFVV